MPRRKPYTERGLARLRCFRCGGPGFSQWQICADGGIYRPLCERCDRALNRLVLRWMRHPHAIELMRRYRP